MKKLVVGAFAAAAIVAASAAPAQAFRYTDPVPGGPGIGAGPHSEFRISVAAVDGGGTDSITLSCPQEWSEHPNAAAACEQLEVAGGYIDAIPAADGMCTKEYAPVQVFVHGHWHGTGRAFIQTYSNRCVAVLATGGALLDL